MSVEVTVHMTALPRALARSGYPAAKVLQARRAAVGEGSAFLMRQLGKNTPVGATGLARQNVSMDVGLVEPEGHVRYAYPAALYMPFVERGTRPHWPPLDPLALWAARKFGYAVGSPQARRAGYLIARKISRVGTKGQHVVRDTANANRSQAQRLMRGAAMGVLRQMGR